MKTLEDRWGFLQQCDEELTVRVGSSRILLYYALKAIKRAVEKLTTTQEFKKSLNHVFIFPS